jgi:hypothetical protein
MFLIVHADRYQPRICLFEFTGMLRELAQLADADRSPVATIENQHDARSAQASESEGLAILIVQREVGSGFEAGERRLRFRQDHLPGDESRNQQEE